MPKNKNAVVRYKILDELLSRYNPSQDMIQLTDTVNKKLYDIQGETVSRRTIEMDLSFLSGPPFYAPINRKGRIIRYEEEGYSIFRKNLTEEERDFLYEVLNTIGQFGGLPHFSWLNGLKVQILKEKKEEVSERKIISFSINDKYNTNYLAFLFDAIRNKIVLKIHYKPFYLDEENIKEFHPYLLKQSRNRWYLLGKSENRPITTLALDRIEKIEVSHNTAYQDNSCALEHYFDDIVGITNYIDKEAEDIIFWADEDNWKYVATKPIHNSQETLDSKVEVKHLRKEYPKLNQGKFFKIRCKVNYELKQELFSHFEGIIVLKPESLRRDIVDSITNMLNLYN